MEKSGWEILFLESKTNKYLLKVTDLWFNHDCIQELKENA